MKIIDRRRFIGGTAAACAFPAVASARNINRRKLEQLDSMANAAIQYMTTSVPATKEMVDHAPGFLMMPLITQGSLLLGAAIGDGVLRIQGKTVDYYQSVQFNVGLQVSAIQYSQAVFFLNEEALNRFRQSDGWKFGAEMRYVVMEDTQTMGLDTLNKFADVVGLTFADSGLHVGLSVEGTKFTPLETVGA